MFIRRRRRLSPMTAHFDTTLVARHAETLTDAEARRHGVKVGEARERVARRAGVAPGFVEGLARGRIKTVSAWVRDKFRELVIREIEAEIRRLEAELAIARQSSSHPTDDDMAAAETALETARKLIRGTR